MDIVCKCVIGPCANGCPCTKTGNMCTFACHMGKPWESVPCLNTEQGSEKRSLRPAEVKMAVCDAGLGPAGDRSEMLNRLLLTTSKNRLRRMGISVEEEMKKIEKEKFEKRKLQETCQFCYKMFVNKISCDRHVKKLHSDKLDSEETSILAKKVEDGFDKKCPHCNRYFKYEFSRENHVKRFHNSADKEDTMEEYRCDVCNKVYIHKISLKRHMVLHSQVPVQFSCKFCDFNTSRKDNLEKHLERLHSFVKLNLDLIRKQEEFKCKLCSEDFGLDRLRFQSHLVLKSCQRKGETLEVNNRGKLQCAKCHRSYADANSLTRHIAWKHREPIGYKCSECEASFKLKSSMNRHKKQEHG